MMTTTTTTSSSRVVAHSFDRPHRQHEEEDFVFGVAALSESVARRC
jgi:hypothetical protein